MSNDFSWTADQREHVMTFTLAGAITEDSDFAPLLRQAANRVVLDLAKIDKINSCGVREWIDFVNALAKKAESIELQRCSVPLVHQLNMVSNFCGTARVTSVYAPYVCPECDAEDVKLVDLAASPTPTLDPSIPCVSCGATMEFDDLPEAYLSFQT